MIDNDYPCLLYPSTKVELTSTIDVLRVNPLVQVTVHHTMPMGYSPLASFVPSGQFEYIVAEVSITPGYDTKDVCNVNAVESLLCDCRNLLLLDNIKSYIVDSPRPKIDFDDTVDNTVHEQDITRLSPGVKKTESTYDVLI